MFRHRTVALALVVLLLPGVARAQDSVFTDALLAGYVVAGFTDTAQTAWCLGRGVCREANPAMRWAIEQSNVPTAMTLKGIWHVGISYALWQQHKRHPVAVRWVAGILTAAQLAVVVHNTQVTKER